MKIQAFFGGDIYGSPESASFPQNTLPGNYPAACCKTFAQSLLGWKAVGKKSTGVLRGFWGLKNKNEMRPTGVEPVTFSSGG